MADWIPDTKPSWWSEVRDFATTPKSYIIGIISTVIASGLLDIGESVTQALKQAFATFGIFGVVTADVLEGAFGPIGEILLGILELFPTILGKLSRSLGPYAPIVVIPGAFLMIWLAAQFGERAAVFLSKRF